MRYAHCPKTHRELASTSKGTEYGHVPGHQYHDVDVVISQSRDNRFRCHIVETWGSAQGYDQEHGRREATGRGESIEEAADNAKSIAAEAGMEAGYLAQAVSKAIDQATEEAAKPGPNDLLATCSDGDFSDCTATGYSWALYGDGRVAATYHSRWQGSTDGARYVTAPGYVDVSEIDPDDRDNDAEATLTITVDGLDPSDDPDFRCTRRGTVVR